MNVRNTPVTTDSDGRAFMLQGDANSDGQINSIDLGRIIGNYFTVGFKTEDINLDGVVNSLDIVRAMDNYFKRSHVGSGRKN